MEPPCTSSSISRFWSSLELHSNPDQGARVCEPADLAVDSSRLAVNDEQGLTGGSHHEMAEHARRHDGPIGRAPLRQTGTHGMPHACDHLHLPWTPQFQA